MDHSLKIPYLIPLKGIRELFLPSVTVNFLTEGVRHDLFAFLAPGIAPGKLLVFNAFF